MTSLSGCPVALIGDVHGTSRTLNKLLAKIPDDRFIVFLGDLTDRGTDSLGVLRTVMNLQKAGRAECLRGNHEKKLLRWMEGADCKTSHGLQTTIDELERCSKEVFDEIKDWLSERPTLLETEEWIAVHAAYQSGLSPGKLKALCTYGETSGRTTEEGYPERTYGWRDSYTGSRHIFHGHDALIDPNDKPGKPLVTETVNGAKVVNVDTGCVFGYSLTACLYPEFTFIQEPVVEADING